MRFDQFFSQLAIGGVGLECDFQRQERRLRQLGLQGGIGQQIMGLHVGGILIESFLGDQDRFQGIGPERHSSGCQGVGRSEQFLEQPTPASPSSLVLSSPESLTAFVEPRFGF